MFTASNPPKSDDPRVKKIVVWEEEIPDSPYDDVSRQCTSLQSAQEAYQKADQFEQMARKLRSMAGMMYSEEKRKAKRER